MEELLPVILSGLIGSIITVIYNKNTNDKNMKLKYITEERRKWRESLRTLIEKIDDKGVQIKKYYLTFAVLLNPDEEMHEKCLEHIKKNEKKESIAELRKILKKDWEKSKWEATESLLSWESIGFIIVFFSLMIIYKAILFKTLKSGGRNIPLELRIGYTIFTLFGWLISVYYLGKRIHSYLLFNSKINMEQSRIIKWVMPFLLYPFVYLKLLIKSNESKFVVVLSAVIIFSTLQFFHVYWTSHWAKLKKIKKFKKFKKFKKKITCGNIMYIIYIALLILVAFIL